MAALKLSTCR